MTIVNYVPIYLIGDLQISQGVRPWPLRGGKSRPNHFAKDGRKRDKVGVGRVGVEPGGCSMCVHTDLGKQPRAITCWDLRQTDRQTDRPRGYYVRSRKYDSRAVLKKNRTMSMLMSRIHVTVPTVLVHRKI